MNFRLTLLMAMLCLAACDGSDSSPPDTPIAVTESSGTFGEPATPEALPSEPVTTVLTAEEEDARAKAIFEASAPADFVLQDEVNYNTQMGASVALADVNEKPSAKRHEMMLNGKQMRFTAQAGHLIAYAPKDPKIPRRRMRKRASFTPPIPAMICRRTSALLHSSGMAGRVRQRSGCIWVHGHHGGLCRMRPTFPEMALPQRRKAFLSWTIWKLCSIRAIWCLSIRPAPAIPPQLSRIQIRSFGALIRTPR